MANVIFKVGTKALFDALEQKDTNTLYWLEDVQELYKGNLLFATGKAASQTAAGLMSAEDKVKLDNLSAGTVAGLTPVDATIVIADGEEGTKTIGVQVSKVEGNTIEIEDDGLYVAKDNTEYAIEKLGDAAEGYSATYRLKKTVDGSSSYVGAEINIPKDLVVQSGSVKTVTEDDQPYAGAKVGDTYIELILNDAEASHIYIPTSGLIDTSDFVVREIVNDDGGTALIFNESTGGGAKYTHQDGTESFVGVNNGGENGMVAQIYADKNVDGNWIGSRINVYQKGIFYHSAEDKASSGYVADDPAHEIATIGDIPDVSGMQGIINSMPDEILSEIVNVQRTETTNTAEIRIFTKQEDGTYSPNVQHGVLTLIPAGQGPDGVSGAGLMTLADKQKLDAIDEEVIFSLNESLVWGSL